jgi:hypothetical protein
VPKAGAGWHGAKVKRTAANAKWSVETGALLAGLVIEGLNFEVRTAKCKLVWFVVCRPKEGMDHGERSGRVSRVLEPLGVGYSIGIFGMTSKVPCPVPCGNQTSSWLRNSDYAVGAASWAVVGCV